MQANNANQTLLGQQQQLGLLGNPATATFAQQLGLIQNQAALNGVGRGAGRGKRPPPNKKGSVCNACRGLDHWAGDPGKHHQGRTPSPAILNLLILPLLIFRMPICDTSCNPAPGSPPASRCLSSPG